MPLPSSFQALQDGGGVMLYLPAHAHRAEHSRAKLAEVGFSDIELVEGVDGYRTDPWAMARDEGWRIRSDLAPGAAAHSLSFLRLLGRIVADDLPYLLIFEDDVLPHPLLETVGPAYWLDTPRDTDWLMMGNQMTIPADDRRSVVVEPCFCTHAFAVTNTGARAALNTLRRRVGNAAGSVHAFDIELIEWMRRGIIRYACWNGAHLPKRFPTSDDVGNDRSQWPEDIAWAVRDSGVFYQNYALGSTLWGPGITWTWGGDDPQPAPGGTA